MATKAIARVAQVTFLLSVILALYLCPTVIGGHLVLFPPHCYQSCLKNTTDVRDDCDFRDFHCVCTHDWITKAVICCFERECPRTGWNIVDGLVRYHCKNRITNISLGSKIHCYDAWRSEVATSVVTIPPWTGATSSREVASYTKAAPSTEALAPTSTTTFTRSTITNVATPLTKLNKLSPSVAPFNGVHLFTGQCTSPRIAFASASAGADMTAYLWVGCSRESHNCCAFSGDEMKFLTVCPHDFATTNSACCPSKWEIYTTNFGGQTPCYISLDTRFAGLPTLTDNATFITDLAFTMKYSLATNESSALSGGAMAGAIIGSVVGGLCLIGIIGYFILHKKRNQKDRDAAPNRGSGDPSLYPRVHEPQELPGSTFIHENHPAFNPSRLQDRPWGES